MQSRRISILIPFKNTTRFLSDCLNSIIAQTYEHWEVLAVNDHSTDDSNSVVQDFASKDDRIKVFQNPGSGIIQALRKAYSESSGNFITRMDSDDIMLPNRLETMVDALTRTGKGHIAVGQVKYFSVREISEGYKQYEQWLNSLTASGTNYTEIYKECVIPSPCWMLYRSDLDLCGAFNSDLYPEDYDLVFRCYEHDLKVIPCGEVLHLWREYGTRTSRTHEHYSADYFLDLKTHHFLKLDHKPERELVIWGTGYKAKRIATKLLEAQADFTWLNANPAKAGKKIYGQKLQPMSVFDDLVNPQSIITIANEKSQQEIREFLNTKGHISGTDYFFFC